MQFKRKGNRIQVLAYRGYDREKRRAIVRMLGAMDAHTLEPSDGLIESLTHSEQAELQAYLETIRQADDLLARQAGARAAPDHIREIADTLRAGDFKPDETWAAQTWESLAVLQRTLRRAGFAKPRKAGRQRSP
ncbi:MAG: hypothetical protein EPN72_10785 [Nevskiaceae bacterium]|nr:MAG: hypothetical protein EPN63_05795 [Nevskiaceae bacterium]TBR72230.1 MAG: hypothetical protein EPN72_10785 [Nevskiaceae bacterium]